MSAPTHLAALYNAAPVILWVEDLLTAAYLGALWQHDRRFKFYIGGGHETIAAVVEDARRAGHRGVFGLRDRDFGPTNRSRWGIGETVNLALETFEVECFLLDPGALAGCVVNTGQRSEDDIRARLDELGRGIVWWMAARRVLAELREARQARFPAHPKRGAVTNQAQAEAVVLGNEWVTATVPGLSAVVAETQLRRALAEAHQFYSQHLTEGTWRRVVAGKELIAELVSWIWTRDRPAGSDGLQDLAKAVARSQVESGRVPDELSELREVLLTRAGVGGA